MASLPSFAVALRRTRPRTPGTCARAGRSARRATAWCALLGALALALAGCAMTDSHVAKKPPPCGAVCQVAATWDNQVQMIPDPVNGGKPSPVLAGRVFLFDQGYQSLSHDVGKITVQLFVEGPPGAEPVLVERWNLDGKTLERLGSRDMVGWGYNLLLPWGTYNPVVSNVEIAVCYEAPGKVPLYSRSKLKLQHTERVFNVTASVQTGNPPAVQPK